MAHRFSRRDLARKLVSPARTATFGIPRTAPTTGPTPVSFDRHLLNRAAFGRNDQTLAELQSMGVTAWLQQQYDHLSIDDSALEDALDGVIEPWRAAAADVRMLTRALYSRRQLAWRMTHFLNNHFSTYRPATAGISETLEDESLFKHCFTDFATVLRISATSPAMIDFLDSQSNIVGSPNENYARELMELHTLGVNAGYTENDVAEAARVFTGWSRVNVRSGGPGTPITQSYFRFRAGRHDTGPKTLSLGWSTPGVSGAQGFLEGFDFLDFLATHPATATRFTEKLCQYFVSDNPPASLLQNVRERFIQSGGDLKVTLNTIFESPEFADPAVIREKVHDGFEVVANCVRRFEIPSANVRALSNEVFELGSLPHHFPVPTGYPEVGGAWLGAGNVLPRWKFADDLVHNSIPLVAVPWPNLFSTPLSTSPAQLVGTLVDRLVDCDVPATTIAALELFLQGRLSTLPPAPPPSSVLPHLQDLASLIIRLPEAQLI